MAETAQNPAHIAGQGPDIGAFSAFGLEHGMIQIGTFDEVAMIPLEQLAALCDRAAAGEGNLADALLPVETALDDIPALAISRADAARLQRGQTVLLRGRDAPLLRGTVYVTASGDLIALADVDRGEIVPKRVFNLAGLHGTSALTKGH